MSETIGTVAIVTFSAQGTGEGVVVFGEEGGAALEVAASQQEDGTWRAVLVGVPAGATGWLQVGLGEHLDAERYTYTTADAPDWLETTHSGTPAEVGFILVPLMGEVRGAAIVTTDGRPVWWWTADLESQRLVSRVQLSADHGTVWFNTFNIEPYSADNDDGVLVGVAIDGSSERSITTHPASHHDFLVLPDDTIAMVVLDDREVSGQIIRGDAIVEIAPDGSERTVWSTWDGFDYIGPPSPIGWWSTLNHLQWIAADNDYICSLKTMTALARIDGESGAVEWVLSEDPAIATLIPDDPFLHQHGFDVLDDGLLLFDNDGASGHSRILRMRFDEEAGRAETTAIYDGTVSSLIMGDVLSRPGGGMMVSWSSAALIEELNQDGESISVIAFPRLTHTGYIAVLPAIGLSASRQ